VRVAVARIPAPAPQIDAPAQAKLNLGFASGGQFHNPFLRDNLEAASNSHPCFSMVQTLREPSIASKTGAERRSIRCGSAIGVDQGDGARHRQAGVGVENHAAQEGVILRERFRWGSDGKVAK
jgi:hypothetical protein